MGKTIRKILVAVVIISSVFISTDCKKQLRCGCGKDIVVNLINAPSYIYFDADKAIISSAIVGNPYGVYYFCNPTEMSPKLADAKYGDVMLVSGNVYYDCSTVYSQSTSGYTSIVQYYELQVTDLSLDLYGKKSANPVN